MGNKSHAAEDNVRDHASGLPRIPLTALEDDN
jgi:hypothetical protein